MTTYAAEQEKMQNETELLLKQDELAFRRLVKSSHNTLLSVARTLVDDVTAEEVVQEAWISIYENLPKFEGKSTLKTWMCRITMNKTISRLRGESKHKKVSNVLDEAQAEDSFYQRFTSDGGWRLPLGEWEENNPEKVLTSDELQECIELILSELPKNQRLVFTLTHIDGENTESICNLMQISMSNMKVLLHRARMKLFGHIANFQESGEC